jgi:hypothetical protein
MGGLRQSEKNAVECFEVNIPYRSTALNHFPRPRLDFSLFRVQDSITL